MGRVTGHIVFCNRPPGSRIKQFVLRCQGQAVGVLLLDPQARLVAYTHVKHGCFHFSQVAAGTYDVVVHPDRAPTVAWKRDVAVRPGVTGNVGNMAPPVS
jgi:hypothetical protein